MGHEQAFHLQYFLPHSDSGNGTADDPQDGGKTDGIRIRAHKPREAQTLEIPKCTDCGGKITEAFGKDARRMAAYTAKNYGVPLCADCAQKRKAAQEAAQEAEGSKE